MGKCVCENVLGIAIIGQSDIVRLFLHAKHHAKSRSTREDHFSIYVNQRYIEQILT